MNKIIIDILDLFSFGGYKEIWDTYMKQYDLIPIPDPIAEKKHLLRGLKYFTKKLKPLSKSFGIEYDQQKYYRRYLRLIKKELIKKYGVKL